jgi:hypothetical protein
MPLSRGEEMTGQTHSQISVSGDGRYATREDFLEIFDEDLRTFRRGLCLRACGLRAVCFRAVRSGALSGTRVRSASWLPGFRSSRRAHSGYSGVGQYLPSGSCRCDDRKRSRLAEAPKA